ncbi:GSCFA domain-containing protein [Ensifer sp. SL37]|uniref:GSCFA domain-containing protein n=1 Tax=Ensifer sp. SL37 TaxID=2995137 RepID=UPI0022736A73|nr:GSCFA domain-containing protein [Ensifer sp. SL37]MCY1741150.1 GSCFA domain-containing protein [Ensifer sp. SL37]
MNPYRDLQDYRFWRRAVSNVETHLFDPVVKPRFTIKPGDKVATAGSCFAQHISRKLKQINFNYFVTEDGSGLSKEDRITRNYGTFSARYGNIYTTTQLFQLFEEAYGRRQPIDAAWQRPDGRFIDPFRQQVEPEGFKNAAAVVADRKVHLAKVRELFEQSDVFVFTLGLTEAWRSKQDGSVFPLAPGVNGGAFDHQKHEFVNLSISDVEQPLFAFLDGLKAVNPKVKVLLTVSPVPLMATFEDRNVLVSTTYSKSVLRVAAEDAIRAYDWVDYFPSYEIITGSFSGGLYYEDDYREVNSLGVAHVMRCFLGNYAEGRKTENLIRQRTVASGATTTYNVVCDEEALGR